MNPKSSAPNAWDDDWESLADKSERPQPQLEESSQKKVSTTRASKAQRRAQQAEFNRQLWQEAEGPKETNYFLETRPGSAVPLKSEFKPPPILLSRKGPTQPSLAGRVNNLSLNDGDSSSEEEKKGPTLEERKAKAAKEREEKQRKYEERREQLFGPSAGGSGTSSPGDLTPPHSRSGTPNRGRGGRGGRGGNSSRSRNESSGRRDAAPAGLKKELYDPTYSLKPPAVEDSGMLKRREKVPSSSTPDIKPMREPRGPDGSGRGGFGFTSRGG